ncbi:hypothetical protein K469DRAFT_753812 [Zopfia rhizophila CBS 207.26]|uniref:Uncharacterized protein n=1 Tax=Zopfia rhizophila CBS 207.26 TaxID=1314779 RepID=A0A6A6DKU5_9PEZI|nr:hypothetical protein K469DRAFT_753812 [Zopfia rhizophila CBS 207.26]
MPRSFLHCQPWQLLLHRLQPHKDFGIDGQESGPPQSEGLRLSPARLSRRLRTIPHELDPSDPEEFKKWLEQKRAECEQLEKELEYGFLSISLNNILEKNAGIFDESLHWIWAMSYTEPSNDLCVTSHFRETVSNSWPELIPGAEAIFFGDHIDDQEQAARDSFTTLASRRSLFAYDPAPTYKKLNPKPVSLDSSTRSQKNSLASQPCRPVSASLTSSSRNTRAPSARPATRATRAIFFVLRGLICAAEFASCSPEPVRFSSTRNPITEKDWDYATILIDDNEGNKAGSAPESGSYWLLNDLVCLKRDVDITSKAGFKNAIVSAIAKGGADGKTLFDAVIFSTNCFVIVRVADVEEQHTKCLSFARKLNTFGRPDSRTPLRTTIKVEEPEDGSLVGNAVPQEYAFYVIALLFGGAQLQQRVAQYWSSEEPWKFDREVVLTNEESTPRSG